MMNVTIRKGRIEKKGTALAMHKRRVCVTLGYLIGQREFSLTHGHMIGKDWEWRLDEADLDQLRAQYEKETGQHIVAMPRPKGRAKKPRQPKAPLTRDSSTSAR